MSSPDASPFARVLSDNLGHPRHGLEEQDLRDLVRILGHELSLNRTAKVRYERIFVLARVVLDDPQRKLTEEAYDAHPLRRSDDPTAEDLRRWYGSWPVALITAIRWTVSPNRGIQSRLRGRGRREKWTPEEAVVRLRDAAFEMGLERCLGMQSREYAELVEVYWQRCRLPGTHPKRMPDRDRLVQLFGSFDAACEAADEALGLGKEGEDEAQR